jgi:hypothetical protein
MTSKWRYIRAVCRLKIADKAQPRESRNAKSWRAIEDEKENEHEDEKNCRSRRF